MTFKQTINNVINNCRLSDDAETVNMIKSFINDAIIEFIRLDEWDKLKVSYELNLDGSDSYDLNTLLDGNYIFESEIALISESTELEKKDYKNYTLETPKTGLWALKGLTLYTPGEDTTVTLIYITPGKEYPLINDSDETLPIKYYSDIIINWASYLMLNWLGDPVADKEYAKLGQKIRMLKSKEQRVRHNGKRKMIIR